jgi:Glycoside-hydrolase family GH114
MRSRIVALFIAASAMTSCTQGLLERVSAIDSSQNTSNLSAWALIPTTPQSWDYRIAKVITTSSQQVVNQDAWNATTASVSGLRNAGKRVICYFSAGTWEYTNDSRGIINKALTDRNANGLIDGSGNLAEAALASAAIQNGDAGYTFNGQSITFGDDQDALINLAGSQLPGWDEYVYKIAGFSASSATPEHKLLRAIINGHMDRAKTLGCDALEPDNIDAYANVTDGITAANQYAYNNWLADAAHAKGMKIYLKNDLDQIPNGGVGVPAGSSAGLVYKFDGIINEECFQFNECETLKPFKDLNKPIFVRQYGIKVSAATYKAGKYNGTSSTRNQIANQLHLNVSVSKYGNGGSPDANANAPTFTFGTW